MANAGDSSGTWLFETPGMAAARGRIGELIDRGLPLAVASVDLTVYGAGGAMQPDDVHDALFAELHLRLAEFASAQGWQAVQISADHHLLLIPDTELPLVERLLGRLADHWGAGLALGATQVVVDVVAGLAASPQHGQVAADLLKRAGSARHEARHLRLPLVVYRNGMEDRRVRRLRLRSDLVSAVARGELSLEYQPQLTLASRRIRTFEALLRWRHPALGPVSPTEFIPLAEESGCITRITEWVLDRALAQLAGWRSAGIELELAVNLSAHDLANPELQQTVRRHLEHHRVDGRRLTLELTEHAVVADMQRAAATMASLARFGVRFALDDYGTGHASLAALRGLPLAEIKIDRAFTRELSSGARDELIVSSTVTLARGMHLKVVAEGIETAQALVAVRALRCDRAQGYFVGRPMDPAGVGRRLADSAPTGASGRGR